MGNMYNMGNKNKKNTTNQLALLNQHAYDEAEQIRTSPSISWESNKIEFIFPTYNL